MMSAFLPNPRLNRRGFADPYAAHALRLAPRRFRDMVRCAVHIPYPTTPTARHFRTPSLCGQPDFTPRLSTFFVPRRSLIKRDFANLSTGLELSWTHARSGLHVATPSRSKTLWAQRPVRQQLSCWMDKPSPVRSPEQRAIFFVAGQTRQTASKSNASTSKLIYPQGLTSHRAPTIVPLCAAPGHRAMQNFVARPDTSRCGPLPVQHIQPKGTPPCSKRS